MQNHKEIKIEGLGGAEFILQCGNIIILQYGDSIMEYNTVQGISTDIFDDINSFRILTSEYCEFAIGICYVQYDRDGINMFSISNDVSISIYSYNKTVKRYNYSISATSVGIYTEKNLIYYESADACGFITIDGNKLALEHPSAALHDSYIAVKLRDCDLHDIYNLDFKRLTTRVESLTEIVYGIDPKETVLTFSWDDDLVIYKNTVSPVPITPDIQYELINSGSTYAGIGIRAQVGIAVYKLVISLREVPHIFTDITEFYRAFTEVLEGVTKSYEHDNEHFYIKMNCQYHKFGKLMNWTFTFKLTALPVTLENKVDYLMARV